MNEEERSFVTAIQAGDIAAVEEWLVNGMCVDVCLLGEGWAPLHVGVLCDTPEVVGLLLRHGASVDQKTRVSTLIPDTVAGAEPQWISRVTPLHLAAQLGRLEIAMRLHAAGADLHARTDRGETALHLAAGQSQSEVVQWLLGLAVSQEDRTVLRATPLFYAAAQRDRKITRLLLLAGASVHAEDIFGRTPLQIAAAGGFEDLVRLLLQYGADPDQRCHEGLHAVQHAASIGSPEVVAILLQQSMMERQPDLLPRDMTQGDRCLMCVHAALERQCDTQIARLSDPAACFLVFAKMGNLYGIARMGWDRVCALPAPVRYQGILRMMQVGAQAGRQLAVRLGDSWQAAWRAERDGLRNVMVAGARLTRLLRILWIGSQAFSPDARPEPADWQSLYGPFVVPMRGGTQRGAALSPRELGVLRVALAQKSTSKIAAMRVQQQIVEYGVCFGPRPWYVDPNRVGVSHARIVSYVLELGQEYCITQSLIWLETGAISWAHQLCRLLEMRSISWYGALLERVVVYGLQCFTAESPVLRVRMVQWLQDDLQLLDDAVEVLRRNATSPTQLRPVLRQAFQVACLLEDRVSAVQIQQYLQRDAVLMVRPLPPYEHTVFSEYSWIRPLFPADAEACVAFDRATMRTPRRAIVVQAYENLQYTGLAHAARCHWALISHAGVCGTLSFIRITPHPPQWRVLWVPHVRWRTQDDPKPQHGMAALRTIPRDRACSAIPEDRDPNRALCS